LLPPPSEEDTAADEPAPKPPLAEKAPLPDDVDEKSPPPLPREATAERPDDEEPNEPNEPNDEEPLELMELEPLASVPKLSTPPPRLLLL